MPLRNPPNDLPFFTNLTDVVVLFTPQCQHYYCVWIVLSCLLAQLSSASFFWIMLVVFTCLLLGRYLKGLPTYHLSVPLPIIQRVNMVSDQIQPCLYEPIQ
jgi:hypothetical protein